MSPPDYDHLFKILIIGDSGVGKSSLLLRFTDNTFTGSYVATIGVDFKIKTLTVDGKKVKMQIWDTAGQERFRTITATYYRGAQGIIVVYDVNDAATFVNVKRWFSEINNHCSDSVAKIIVGNKDDSSESKQVASDDLEVVAKEYGVPKIETSAKMNVNVAEMFHIVASEIIRSGACGSRSDGNPNGSPVKIKRVNASGSGDSKKCC